MCEIPRRALQAEFWLWGDAGQCQYGEQRDASPPRAFPELGREAAARHSRKYFTPLLSKEETGERATFPRLSFEERA